MSQICFPDKFNCKLVMIGLCHRHPKCKKGRKCKYLLSKSCSYYHPPDHFYDLSPQSSSRIPLLTNRVESDDDSVDTRIRNKHRRHRRGSSSRHRRRRSSRSDHHRDDHRGFSRNYGKRSRSRRRRHSSGEHDDKKHRKHKERRHHKRKHHKDKDRDKDKRDFSDDTSESDQSSILSQIDDTHHSNDNLTNKNNHSNDIVCNPIIKVADGNDKKTLNGNIQTINGQQDDQTSNIDIHVTPLTKQTDVDNAMDDISNDNIVAMPALIPDQSTIENNELKINNDINTMDIEHNSVINNTNQIDLNDMDIEPTSSSIILNEKIVDQPILTQMDIISDDNSNIVNSFQLTDNNNDQTRNENENESDMDLDSNLTNGQINDKANQKDNDKEDNNNDVNNIQSKQLSLEKINQSNTMIIDNNNDNDNGDDDGGDNDNDNNMSDIENIDDKDLKQEIIYSLAEIKEQSDKKKQLLSDIKVPDEINKQRKYLYILRRHEKSIGTENGELYKYLNYSGEKDPHARVHIFRT